MQDLTLILTLIPDRLIVLDQRVSTVVLPFVQHSTHQEAQRLELFRPPAGSILDLFRARKPDRDLVPGTALVALLERLWERGRNHGADLAPRLMAEPYEQRLRRRRIGVQANGRRVPNYFVEDPRRPTLRVESIAATPGCKGRHDQAENYPRP